MGILSMWSIFGVRPHPDTHPWIGFLYLSSA